jgi:cytochrome c-type biogenesis protein CcmH/NrfG
MNEKTEVLTATEARQASPRRLNFRVLVFSMALAVVVAAIVYYAIYAYPDSSIGVPEVTSEEPATTEPGAPESVTP